MDATCTLATTENVTGRSYSLGVFFHGGGNIWDAGSGSSCHNHKFHVRGIVFLRRAEFFIRQETFHWGSFSWGKRSVTSLVVVTMWPLHGRLNKKIATFYSLLHPYSTPPIGGDPIRIRVVN